MSLACRRAARVRLRGNAVASDVVASATDGYQVVFSLAELDPAFTSNDIIVADTIDGKPLFAYQGPLRIVAPKDSRGAAVRGRSGCFNAWTSYGFGSDAMTRGCLVCLAALWIALVGVVAPAQTAYDWTLPRGFPRRPCRRTIRRPRPRWSWGATSSTTRAFPGTGRNRARAVTSRRRPSPTAGGAASGPRANSIRAAA
jgi:hypothetical protein